MCLCLSVSVSMSFLCLAGVKPQNVESVLRPLTDEIERLGPLKEVCVCVCVCARSKRSVSIRGTQFVGQKDRWADRQIVSQP